MITKTGGSGKKSDDSTSKMIPSPPSPKNPVVYSFNRPTFESILNEYPELVQFFELRQVVPTYEPDSNISKSKNTTSKSRPSTQNGKFSFNKIFNFSSNKSEQKGIFGFGKNKNKNNTNSNNKSTSPPPSTVRESLQRSALSLSNSLEINDLIEKKLRRDFITINEEIKNIPKINFNYNKIPDKRSRKKNQNLNTNALTYSYMIKILTYLKYQERLKICEAQHDHCEKHKKYIQNLLEIVNIVNKEYPNSDLIINGKLLNYSIMNDEKLLLAAAAAAQSSQASNSSPPSPIQNLHKTEIGSTVKKLREKTMKHEKRKNLLSYKIKILIAKENSSRLTLINDLINKLFNIDSNGSITSSTPNTNSIAKKEIKSNPIKRRSKLNRGRKTSPSATKSYSSSNLMQLSRRQSDITPKNDNSDIPSALADKKERKSFNDLDENDNYNDDENKDTSPNSKNLQNPRSVSKSSSSSTLFQTSDQNNLSDDKFDIHSDNYNDNDNKLKNFDNNNYSPITTNTISIPTFEDENDIIFNSASSSVSNMKLTDFDEAIKELASNESSDKIPPLNTSNSDLLKHKNRTAVKDPCASSDDIILSDSESIQNKNKKLEDDYEYSLYSDNELELNENDENLTEFQNLDENDILFEKTLTYIEDNDGQFLDFELLIEKASECTEFKLELISLTIRKIKKSPKDSGIHILKLCQIFMDVFLEFEKKREQQILQQTKMERDAIIASQKNKVMPVNSYGLVPYTVQSTNSTNNANNKNGGNEICNKEEEEEKQKDVMRFLFVMFSKYIFNEIYTTTFHQEFFYMQDFLFSNSILNGLDQIPSITNELIPVLPYLPTDLHDLRIRDFTEYESFRDYSKCVEDVMMLQFESSLVDFCYAAFKILDRIQKIASAILFDKKIEAELEKQRDGFASSYHGPSNFIPMGGINSDNYSNKSKPTENKQNQVNSTSDNERGNSNSLPKATISGINFGDTNDEESSNNKFISSSPSNSSVSMQKDSSSMYSSKKSQMQLRADCQLSCDQLCDITTVIVIIAGPFDLRKLIDLYSPFVNGLRLSSQLEFAFLTFQSVCSNILESFNPMSTNNTIKRKKRKEEQRMKREEEQRIQAEKENEQRQKQSENEQQKEEENQVQINSEEN